MNAQQMNQMQQMQMLQDKMVCEAARQRQISGDWRGQDKIMQQIKEEYDRRREQQGPPVIFGGNKGGGGY